jgi:uncharacterized spore protein YtfJ
VKLLHVAPPVTTTIDRVIETVPEVIDRVSDFIKKDKKEKKDKAQTPEAALL